MASDLFVRMTENLLVGFERVEENRGCAGSDGQSIEEFALALDWNLNKLRQELLTGRYEPLLLRQIWIEKPTGGHRRLLVPAVRDRVVQTSLSLLLGPILDKEFEEVSYAYRRGRSVEQAVRRVIALRDLGYRWVVDADIDAYFDEIPHDALLEVLGRYVSDRAILDLVRSWLSCPFVNSGKIDRLEKGIPQGSPVSPLLANLYLDRLDEAFLKKGYKVVRYADDFIVLCKTRPQAEEALELSAEVLKQLALKLDPEKTDLTHFDTGFQFLGVHFLRGLAFKPVFNAEVKDDAPGVGAPPSRALSAPPPPASGEAEEDSKPPQTQPVAGAIRQSVEDTTAVPPPPKEGAVAHDPVLRTLYIQEQGARLSRTGRRFVISKNDLTLAEYPALKTNQILVFGNVSITTPAAQFCLKADIPVYFLSRNGNYLGSLESMAPERVLLQELQWRWCRDPVFCLEISKGFVRGKITNCRTFLLRAARRRDEDSFRQATLQLEASLRALQSAESLAELRGVEGNAAAVYFGVWNRLVGEEWKFPGRRRRPPPDPVNSLLSYGYTILYSNVRSFVRVRGLHPHVGFYHTPDLAHASLASDLVEEFRVPVVDSTVLRVIHRREVGLDGFELDGRGGMCTMLPVTRRKLIVALEQTFNREVLRPNESRSQNYRRAIETQAERLAAAVKEGVPSYAPFLIR